MKKFVLISSVLIFILSSLIHSLYDIIPLPIFPVNESIWEHNKMIFISYFIFAVILKTFKKEKNAFFATLISCIICIALVNLIFTPIYLYVLETKDIMIVTLTIYFLSIVVSLIPCYKLLNKSVNNKRELISLIMYPIIMILFVYLTYNPLQLNIFYDFNSNCSGMCNN